MENKIKMYPLFQHFFPVPVGFVFPQTECLKELKKCLTDYLEWRREIVNDIVKISKWFIHLCVFCIPWPHSFPWFSRSYSSGRKTMFAGPGCIYSVEAQEGLSAPSSSWPRWRRQTLPKGIHIFSQWFSFLFIQRMILKPPSYFKYILIIWGWEDIKNNAIQMLSTLLWFLHPIYFKKIVKNVDRIKCSHINEQMTCLTKQAAGG